MQAWAMNSNVQLFEAMRSHTAPLWEAQQLTRRNKDLRRPKGTETPPTAGHSVKTQARARRLSSILYWSESLFLNKSIFPAGLEISGSAEHVSSAGFATSTCVSLCVLHLLVGSLGDGSEAGSYN